MAVAPKSLALNDQIAATTAGTAETLYTAANVTAQIDALTVVNPSGSGINISLFILADGVAATAVDPFVKTIPANSSVIISELIGHKIPKGGSLAAFAGTTNELRVTASGVEFT
jgi:hypothetical protein